MKIHICTDDGELLDSRHVANPVCDLDLPVSDHELERLAAWEGSDAAQGGFRIILARMRREIIEGRIVDLSKVKASDKRCSECGSRVCKGGSDCDAVNTDESGV